MGVTEVVVGQRRVEDDAGSTGHGPHSTVTRLTRRTPPEPVDRGGPSVLAGGEGPGPVAGGLDGHQERGPHLVLLELAQGGRRRARR
jgi:hypothetical protein